nr:L-aspartate oxidase [Aidingimonas lacisalsi]
MRTPASLLIVGGGVAGLALALELADTRPVTLLRPASDDHGASRWAQGGIAAVLSPDDDIEAHIQDTLDAGDGLCDVGAVRFTVEHGRQAIDWLIQLGMPFTPDPDPRSHYPYHLTREGGHGARRVIHAADATGRALIETLLHHVKRHPGITLHDDFMVIDLLGDGTGCLGARCLDRAGRLHELRAGDTVLATGGASGLYRHTTSPHPACGEGMMMAAELGCELRNLEFQQFHPTCLYDPDGPPFLISEALRGEGGYLRTLDGHRFMPSIDPRAELAPRDIVARAIDTEMHRSHSDHVWLDMTHLPADQVMRQFPTIYGHCIGRGLDITDSPIPVVPAAHYSCGGIASDLTGATDVPHLYAIGEVAYTGLHGANRMASNSLLECLVFAHAAADRLKRAASRPRPGTDVSPIVIPPAHTTRLAPDRIAAMMERLRTIMSQYVGIVRHDEGLHRASAQLAALSQESHELRARHAPDIALSRLDQAARLATLVVAAARERRESRGLHFNLDCSAHATEPPHPSRQRV